MNSNNTIRGSGAALPCVPVLDVRNGGPVEHARLRPAQAAAVRDHCLGWLPAGRALAWLGDPLVRGWLRRSGSTYVGDIGAIAGTVGGAGTWLLHGAYLFGCTALVDEGGDGPRLRRTLDWPFPGLGHLVEVAHQAGTAGDYLSVTWPGFAGVLTAVAPGRFAAAINQAPMRRITNAAWLRWIDYGLNAIRALARSGGELPEHLLRRAFETCDSFEAARELLRTAPVARPVLFTLTGTRAGEVAVIERTETAARVFDGAATVANAWRQAMPGWEPRVCGVGTPVENNRRRRAALAPWTGRAGRCFGWAQAPVVNSFTRLTVEMEAACGALRVAGWEADGRGGAAPVTRNLSLTDRVATTCADDAPEIAA
ncbi:MAG TPA: hypothetical protein VJ890_09630 [Vineibacter sp.]|nr:hypothetical protein [Vineibacter sp.]